MSGNLDSLKREFEEIIDYALGFCFPVRAKALQLEAVEKLEHLEQRISDLKQEKARSQESDVANQLLSMEEMIKAVANELKMWIALKENSPHKAWDYLVGARGHARASMQAHRITEHFQYYIERLYTLEKVVFPPQVFVSPGFIIKRSVCSICGQNYGECEHVVGRAYNGQLCARIIEEAELLEISIVSDPANRSARILTISDEDGVPRDVMTWLPVEIEDNSMG